MATAGGACPRLGVSPAGPASGAAAAAQVVRQRPVRRCTGGGSPCSWLRPRATANLCRLVTRMKMRAAKGDGALALDELDGCTAGLVALAGRPLLDGRRHGVGGLLDRLVGLFGRANVCVDLQRHLLRDEESDNVALTALAQAFRVPVVATNGVRFATPADRPLFDVLTCVQHRTTLEAAGRQLARNAERYLKSPEAMAHAVRGSARRAARHRGAGRTARIHDGRPRLPLPDVSGTGRRNRDVVPAATSPRPVRANRYRPYHDKAQRADRARAGDLIERLELAGYFLDRLGHRQLLPAAGHPGAGRGSAANSAVCYSLGITAVDPVGMELLFERFLSEERGEWPDIDLDLPSGDRRERVISTVYEKYGRLGAAMTANVITYRGRSAAREVGKALSLGADDDRSAGQGDEPLRVSAIRTRRFARNLASVGLSIGMPRMRTFGDLWRQMQDLPRHLGQHSGGMVVCAGRARQRGAARAGQHAGPRGGAVGQGRLRRHGHRQGGPAGPGHDGRAAGRHRAGQQPMRRRARRFDLAHIPPDDPAVYELLQKADTIGVFQVESRAQMATLPRMKPTKFYDLVVEVAIIRPGPIVGQMVHPVSESPRGPRSRWCRCTRRSSRCCARTLGVPLFQEQLLRMAMVAASFTGGQAEELRRAMGFKRVGEAHEARSSCSCARAWRRTASPARRPRRIITSITSFALYGFPESHAASFALLAYASAYLKVHYPAAFYTALLNNQPMGFYHPATLVKDAQRRGVRFHPIDVQQSDWLCRVEHDGAIRLGLMYVHGLRKDGGQAMAAFDQARRRVFRRRHSCAASADADDDSMIEVVADAAPRPRRRRAARISATSARTSGPWRSSRSAAFTSIEQLVQRTGLRRDELTTLADIGALNAFTHERRSALWQVERAVRPAGELLQARVRSAWPVPPA